MSFYAQCAQYGAMPLAGRFAAVTGDDVRRVLAGPCRVPGDLLALLSPAATPFLEEMAGQASQLTLQYFGRTIQLFTPLYLSNHCSNHCVYCGFNATNVIPRSQLTLEQVEIEARAIAATGLRQLLILTGESRAKASPDYLESCLGVLRCHFPSVSMEIYAMEQAEYERMIRAGIDGLTLFQETYDEALYAKLHPRGPKRDYRFRLDAPERGCRAGMRVVNIGALLGLGDWRKDALLTGLHAAYLQRQYPEVDIAVSLPRMRPHAGEFQPASLVSDADLVQIMLAFRLFLPRLGITISTRETARLRDNLLPLGVTRMSAGVSTAVGGHSQEGDKVGQFEISDDRSVDAMCAMLKARGFQPVFADWQPPGRRVCDVAAGRPASGMRAMNAAEQGIAVYLGEARLRHLQSVTVGIAGAGGLGSNCAMLLVRSGFKRFVLVDFDCVDSSNLNRQTYGADQIGQLKVAALTRNLLAVNPDIVIDQRTVRVTPENMQAVFAGCDAVIEAFDNPQCKRALVEALVPTGMLVVAASGIGGHGNADAIVTRRVRDNFIMIGDMETECSLEHPPFAPRVALAAAKQADAVLSHFLNTFNGQGGA